MSKLLAYYTPDLQQWHDPTALGARRWRLTDRGLEVQEGGILRTDGEPQTVRRIIGQYRADLEFAARTCAVPIEILVATVCTESGGNPKALRIEPRYISDEKTPGRISYGLTQTLLSSAGEAMGFPVDRTWLEKPLNALLAGGKCIYRKRGVTKYDPPLVAGAYNAGSLRPSTRNPWGLVCTDDGDNDPTDGGDHVTKWVKWFNDAWAVLSEGAAV